jgi:hypothetical protein
VRLVAALWIADPSGDALGRPVPTVELGLRALAAEREGDDYAVLDAAAELYRRRRRLRPAPPPGEDEG